MKTLEELGCSPAPWHTDIRPHKTYQSHDVVGANDLLVCGIYGGPSGRQFADSNTHLIAAAPDLYQALASLLHCAGAPFTKESGMSVAMDMARKALAKAEGTK